MKKFTCLAAIAAATLTVATPAAAQRTMSYTNSSQDEEARFDAAQQRFEREYQLFREAVDRYQTTRSRGGDWRDGRPGGTGYVDPRDEEFYDASRDYRDGPGYRERVLTRDDRVYRGQDGRYYCKRSDGTTGLIVGAAAGGLFGNVIAGGRSRTLGTVLGAVIGGAAGASIDRSNPEVRCR